MTPPRDTLSSAQRALFQQAQAYEDAIAYRRARLATPCRGCHGPARCDDHAVDMNLIASYQRAGAACCHLIGSQDPTRAG